MYVLGHVGLTAAAAANRDMDLRLACLLSILPDLIDKPVSLLFPDMFSGNTRGFGHTLLAVIAVTTALVVLRRRHRDGLVLGACYGAHLLLDLCWTSNHPVVLFWPLLGSFPASISESYLPVYRVYNLAGELLGLLVILALIWRCRLYAPARLRAFAWSGRLSPKAPRLP